MVMLYPEKLLTIITIDSIEESLLCSFRTYGVSGYTILRARGAGSSGVQDDISGFDSTNIMVKVVIPPERLEKLLESLNRKIQKGYHLTVFVSDVEVMRPEKFNKPLL